MLGKLLPRFATRGIQYVMCGRTLRRDVVKEFLVIIFVLYSICMRFQG